MCIMERFHSLLIYHFKYITFKPPVSDLLAISIQDTEDAHTASRQIYMNVIIEYDLNNGMGNDTATTKYTS